MEKLSKALEERIEKTGKIKSTEKSKMVKLEEALKLRKAKYLKRTGSPGKYKYFYRKPTGGKKVQTAADNIKFFEEHGIPVSKIKKEAKKGNFSNMISSVLGKNLSKIQEGNEAQSEMTVEMVEDGKTLMEWDVYETFNTYKATKKGIVETQYDVPEEAYGEEGYAGDEDEEPVQLIDSDASMEDMLAIVKMEKYPKTSKILSPAKFKKELERIKDNLSS